MWKRLNRAVWKGGRVPQKAPPGKNPRGPDPETVAPVRLCPPKNAPQVKPDPQGRSLLSWSLTVGPLQEKAPTDGIEHGHAANVAPVVLDEALELLHGLVAPAALKFLSVRLSEQQWVEGRDPVREKAFSPRERPHSEGPEPGTSQAKDDSTAFLKEGVKVERASEGQHGPVG